MAADIYDPLTEYVNVFRGRFREVAKNTFAKLAEEAKVNVEANRATCRQLYSLEDSISELKSSIRKWNALSILLWVVFGVGGALAIMEYSNLPTQAFVAILVGVGAVLLLQLQWVMPRLNTLKEERDDQEGTAARLKAEAWKQMEPLNRLYDWDVLTRMMTQTVPRLEFDPYFTTQRLADLQHVYGWDGTFNDERSVIYSHSGLINGNPFVICRTRKMEMGTQTYTGTKTIYWTTYERGSDGKRHAVQHSQVLTATVTAPCPGYYEMTRIIYGNTAAPNLIFYRRQSGLAGHEGSMKFKMKLRELRKKARDLSNADFAMMTNEEFEVIFDTSNRSSNQEFALLFTPLAQESMLKLLRDESTGYGDDFDFSKYKMINTILPTHLQELDLDMNPAQYKHFDYDVACTDFQEINSRYFRAIYFALAPLLCIPPYQQIRPLEAIYGRDMPQHSSFWEHEALANFWGQNHFKAPNCVTDCILKTKQIGGEGDDSTIIVYAHGYSARKRLTYVSVVGGDGRSHEVPVYWNEYKPVTGMGKIEMREDNTDTVDSSTSQLQRLSHIHQVLEDNNLKLYRRHIGSKII